MKKIIFVFLTACMFSFILGCSKAEEKETTTNNTEDTSEDTTKQTEVTGEKEVAEEESKEDEDTQESNDDSSEGSSEESSEQPAEQDPGLTVYRPEVGTIKQFTDGEDIVLTEEVIATNDQYVQLSLTLGGNQSIQVYEWTATEIALVYEEVTVEDSKQNILDSFTPGGDREVLLSLNGSKTQWEVKESALKLELSSGKYEGVYLLEKITDEVKGADTIYTRYYAPGIGLVKETLEVTGENGYKGEMELVSE